MKRPLVDSSCPKGTILLPSNTSSSDVTSANLLNQYLLFHSPLADNQCQPVALLSRMFSLSKNIPPLNLRNMTNLRGQAVFKHASHPGVIQRRKSKLSHATGCERCVCCFSKTRKPNTSALFSWQWLSWLRHGWQNMCSMCVIFKFSSVNLHPNVGVVVSNPEGPLIYSLSTVGRITFIYL